jgi:hypothetical protein
MVTLPEGTSGHSSFWIRNVSFGQYLNLRSRVVQHNKYYACSDPAPPVTRGSGGAREEGAVSAQEGPCLDSICIRAGCKSRYTIGIASSPVPSWDLATRNSHKGETKSETIRGLDILDSTSRIP